MSFLHPTTSYLRLYPPHLVPNYVPQLVQSKKAFKSLQDATINMLHKVTPQKVDPKINYIEKSTERPNPQNSIDQSKGEKSTEVGIHIKSALVQPGGQNLEPEVAAQDQVLTFKHFKNLDEDSDSDSVSLSSLISELSSESLDSQQEQKIAAAQKHPVKVTELQIEDLKNAVESPGNTTGNIAVI